MTQPKPSFKYLFFTAVLFFFFSCQKQFDTPAANGNEQKRPNQQPGGNGGGRNLPPVANAGADQATTSNTINLNGSGSTDPNNNISSYAWTKISGPSSFNIVNANVVQTQVTNLVQGVYQFELKVTDVRGLFDKDTVQITRLSSVCDNSNRPLINAQLVPFGTLSQARFGMGVGAGAGKIVFAGGYTSSNWTTTTTRVDIYDVNTQSWSTAELSEPRGEVCVAAVGNKIFFAGGQYYEYYGSRDGEFFPVYVMDIYDVTTNAWSVVDLPYGAIFRESAVVDNKIFFSDRSNINIYDLNTQSWSTTSLNDRSDFTMVAANNKVYFAGGSDFVGGPSNRIDIYDNATNTWSVSNLAEAKSYTAGIVAADKVYFAGGYISQYSTSCSVDIIDANTGAQSVQYLSRPSTGRMATMPNKIAFINGNEFDIYNIATNTWSIGILPVGQNDLITNSFIFSGYNSIYIAGAYPSSSTSISNIVYKLEF